ncbi:hypothetical protein I4U23_025102 [Adineta vaga]|nr:hypothetical protein I4U23_025102 [Adineta vaga]
MNTILIIVIRKLWKHFYYFLCLFLLIVIIFTFDYYPNTPQALLYTSRLREQDMTKHKYVKFRDLSLLSNTCEQMSTIDCLNYLDKNQSNYFQKLSSTQSRIFQNQYCTQKKKMLFHTFWNNPNQLDNPLLLLHIQSHLYTQNRHCSQLIIWTLPMFYGAINPMYNVHYPYLQFRTLTPFMKELQQVGVHINSYRFWLFDRWFVSKMVALSDAVRFILLHKFGGMYIDADILLLRDLQPFYEHEFAYRWSTLNEYNTAILRLFPQSNISSILLHQAYEKQSPAVFFPWSIRSSLLPVSLVRLPSVFFDPLWLAADNADHKTANLWKFINNTRHTFESVFHKESYLSQQGRTVLNGAFTFHWHALHKVGQFEQGSYLFQWNEFFQEPLLDMI